MKRRFTYLTVVAVVTAASAASAASASVAAGPHWLVQPTPNRAAPSNMLMGVSCTSGTFCILALPVGSGFKDMTLAERR